MQVLLSDTFADLSQLPSELARNLLLLPATAKSTHFFSLFCLLFTVYHPLPARHLSLRTLSHDNCHFGNPWILFGKMLRKSAHHEERTASRITLLLFKISPYCANYTATNCFLTLKQAL